MRLPLSYQTNALRSSGSECVSKLLSRSSNSIAKAQCLQPPGECGAKYNRRSSKHLPELVHTGAATPEEWLAAAVQEIWHSESQKMWPEAFVLLEEQNASQVSGRTPQPALSEWSGLSRALPRHDESEQWHGPGCFQILKIFVQIQVVIFFTTGEPGA